MNRARLILLLVAALTLSGCANTSSWRVPEFLKPAPRSAVSDRDLDELLAFYYGMASHSDRALENERRFYAAALINGRCDDARMRLGLALLRSAERGKRFEGGDKVMQPCLGTPERWRVQVHQLAHLVDAQLRTVGKEQARYQSVLQENQELRRQLDGLKAIERSLQDRRLELEMNRGTAR